MDARAFQTLNEFLSKVPAVRPAISFGNSDEMWWAVFSIDIDHKLSWHTVQEMSHVLNSISVNEVLPTRFYPKSPPPYLNGGPDEYLTWTIECTDLHFKPAHVKKWLEERLPSPVEDERVWIGK